MDAGVTAMVVGYQQALIGDDFSGTATAELNYSVFERRRVDIVDVFGRKAAADIAHGFGVELLKERRSHIPSSALAPKVKRTAAAIAKNFFIIADS